MKIRPEDLIAHLDKPLQPLYVLHGNEPLQITESSDAIRQAAHRQGYTQRTVLMVSPTFRWSDLQLAADHRSLFGGMNFIDLRIPTGKPGRDGASVLQHFCKALPPDTVTLVSLPFLDWRVLKSNWFSALSQAGIMIECQTPPVHRLPAWIKSRLAQQKQSADPDALSFLVVHVEGNLLAAHQEIQKLGLLYPLAP